ncbi:hypothetical protein Tdes44962_MAKER09538 [Teratosphaeria destructans]|uniref:Uncharacterized protein n=1 Tax=Teratosphaeria destructans TaxID=418781 RepID=A0A9W7W2K9_9PEZI|nr:hypothetical protein Tdes44962_MAKER09538 [Teratosphaeria destructans]
MHSLLAYTPPSPATEKPHHRLPPSPPLSPTPKIPRLSSVDRLLRVLRLYHAGRLSDASDWRSLPLSATQFEEFERILRADAALSAWCDDKARYDFDGETFTLRMPSKVHESFRGSVARAIEAGISELAGRVEEGAIKDALKGIWEGGSTDLRLRAPVFENSSQESQSQEGRIVQLCPDAAFYAEDAELPNMVVEVSYSQQKKELPRLADDHIMYSGHAIKCVVGLDIPYGKGEKDASVSVWRAGLDDDGVGICRCDVDGAIFTRADGEAAEGVLELRMDDLLPEEMLEGKMADEKISIPFSDLAAYLKTALQRASPKALAKRTSQPTRLRKRKRTPDEELSSGREDGYARQEAAEVEREQAKDGAWRARGRRKVGTSEEMPVRSTRSSARRNATVN